MGSQIVGVGPTGEDVVDAVCGRFDRAFQPLDRRQVYLTVRMDLAVYGAFHLTVRMDRAVSGAFPPCQQHSCGDYYEVVSIQITPGWQVVVHKCLLSVCQTSEDGALAERTMSNSYRVGQ